MKTSCSAVISSDPSASTGMSGEVIEVARAVLSVLAGGGRMADPFYGYLDGDSIQINKYKCV